MLIDLFSKTILFLFFSLPVLAEQTQTESTQNDSEYLQIQREEYRETITNQDLLDTIIKFTPPDEVFYQKHFFMPFKTTEATKEVFEKQVLSNSDLLQNQSEKTDHFSEFMSHCTLKLTPINWDFCNSKIGIQNFPFGFRYNYNGNGILFEYRIKIE